jgi:hypothetical protein
MVKTFYDPEVDRRAELRTRRRYIFELLEDIGDISEEAEGIVEKEKDFEVLRKWLKLAARANSIDEFVNNARLN